MFSLIPPDSVIEYNDVKTRIIFALLCAQLIVWHNETKGAVEFLTTKSYYTALTFSFILATILIEWIYRVSLVLYQKRYGRRCQLLLSVVLLTVLAPTLFLFLMDTRYYVYFNIDVNDHSSLKEYLLLITFLMVLLDYRYYLCFTNRTYYVVLSLGQITGANLVVAIEQSDENGANAEQLIDQINTIELVTDGFVLFKSRNGVNLAVNEDGEVTVWNDTLRDTMKRLDVSDYFQISRRYIVKRDNILSMDKATSQRVALQLKAPVGKSVMVSENNTPRFKVWFGKS